MDQARKLPTQLAELPVTVVSRALQAGMRVQQHVTELAIRGDEVFALLRPVDDSPPWARFDEDEVEVDEADVARAMAPEGPLAPEEPVAPDQTPGTTTPGTTPSGLGTPPALPGYDEMSLPQLRGKLRALSLQQLEALLEHEHAHHDRAPFVTMLSNRIVTVRSR
ncbi:MAG: lipid droplet-associated protein [Pseudonocardiaceae bacterium]